ncbi:hypothetical protein [Solobacterium moorei]|uniref:hypothetical protein n=1 Tax=Solobacterium moorei TaxID=102148 RepID=UPI0023F03688|nr:hypothetical protein [Solobacterium moorei]
MGKYKIIFEGEEEDEVFGSYEEAEEYALYLVSCYHTGGETLEMSNPGDYPYDPDDEPEYEIVEIDDAL